jgi:NAD(P)-dependent dehydrogenase (short-subunit alcohol dehydrogenase family)
VIALTRSVALRYGSAGDGERGRAGMRRDRLAASSPPEERARYTGAILGCFSAREEVAVLVGFPAGGGASFANGATVEVSGGWHMA